MTIKLHAFRNGARPWKLEAETLRGDDTLLSGHREIFTKEAATAGPQTAASPNTGPQHLPGVLVINEIDSDTPSTDVLEFVELYDGGLGNMSLNGYVLVFFNGNLAGDTSYAAFDLDGFTTDANGYFVAGNSGVAGVDLVFANGTLQNGQDAVALYIGDATSWPTGTAPTTANLVDAIVYDTGQADDTALLTALGETTQYNENENASGSTQALARVPNETGGFVAQAPTPGAANIVTETQTVVFNPVTVTVAEGDSGTTNFVFTVTRSGGTTGQLDFSGTIALGTGVDGVDFVGGVAPTVFSGSILAGQTSATVTISVQGDDIVESDESYTLTLTTVSNAAANTTEVIGANNVATGNITNDDAIGTLAINDLSMAEGDSGTTNFIFTVTRSGGDDGAISVDYTINIPGGAGNADATDIPGTLTGTVSFADGETSKQIIVGVSGDTDFEPPENFSVTLSNPQGGTSITDGTGAGTIQNDDAAPAGTLSINDVSLAEGNSGPTTFTFTVTRTGGTNGAVTVDYTIAAPGGAGNADSADFVSGSIFSGQLSFANGEDTKTITIDVEGDTVFEADEAFTVTLSNATGGAGIGDGSGAGTIQNDDAAPVAGSVSVSNVSIVEGNAGTSLLTFTLTRTGGTGAFDVNYATSNGGDPTHASATAGSDYVLASGTASFGVGVNTQTVSITINGDLTPELSEEFTLTLSGATNGATIGSGTAIGTITTDDAPPASTLIFSENFTGFTAGGFAPSPTAGQIDSDIWRVVGLSDIPTPAYGFTGAAGTDFGRGTITTNDPTTAGVYSVSTNAALVVQPTGAEMEAGGFIEARIVNTSGSTATGFDIVFDWAYRNSADRASSLQFSYSTDGTNFITVPAANFTTPGTLAAGAVFTTQNEMLSLSGLSVANGDAIFLRWTHVSSTGSGSRDEVGIDNLTVNATGGATGPLVSVSDVSVNEAAGTMTFTVTRSNVAAGAFTVDYETANGSALAGSDYVATSGTLSFADNQVSATVTVTINDEAIPELNETLFLNLLNPVGATIADAQGVGTITNDDGTPIQISVNDVSIAEGQAGTSTLTFTVTRTGGTGAFDVSYTTADDSATQPSDYLTASGTLSFGVGVNTQTVSVTINGDLDQESTERFFVNLFNPTNNAIVIDAQGIGTITNDEPTYIHDIQGTAYYSPILAGDGISTFNTASTTTVVVRAIVTAVDNVGNRQGYYLTEEISDWDGNTYTSEGIFVMTRNDAGVGNVVSGVSVGDLVQLSANVMEYQAFSTMPRTVLVNPTGLSVVSTGNALPVVTLTGIPNTVMTPVAPDYTDSSDGVGDTFDASVYALSYFETVEGMLVTIPNMVVADGFVGTSGGDPFFQAYSLDSANVEQINSRGGYTIGGDPVLAPPDTANPNDTTVNGGQVLHDGDINPDIIELDFTDFAVAPPPGLADGATMGDYLGDVTGIIDFDFTALKLFVTDIDAGSYVDTDPAIETTTFGDDSRSLTVATFNVENLDPGDGAARFTAIANAIANNLNSPDIICIEEMQDNNGATNDGTVDASTTWGMLVAALNAATGKVYQWVDQAPTNGAEGGEPGGNIRVGFLYDTGRVQLGNLDANATLAERRQYTDRIGDGVRDAGDLIAFDDSMLGAEINTTDWAGTRRSLLGEFTFHGNTVYVTANHWPAKGGSGEFWQFDQSGGDPANSDWAQRNAVAQDVYSMLNLVQAGNANAGLVAGGDFNDFYFYRPLTTMTGHTLADGTARVGGIRLENLTLTLPEAERYTYTFDGRSQAIDHIIVNNLLANVATYDVVHLNTGFNPANNPQLSDHDPGLATFDYRSFGELLIGTGNVETIEGFGGNDILIGNGSPGGQGAGSQDTLIGGSGDDIYRAEFTGITIVEAVGGGFDRVYVENNFVLGAGQEIELLSYIAPSAVPPLGGVTLIGNAFSQTIIGSAGADQLISGGGGDVMVGGLGDDVYSIQHAGDKVIEGVGGGIERVFVTSTLGSYTLQAGAEVEFVTVSGAGGTTLIGNEFFNYLTGSSGVDTLIGGGGNDFLDGKASGDIYRIDDFGDIIVEATSGSTGIDQAYVAMNLSGFVLGNDTGVEVLAAIDAASTAVFNLTGNNVANTIFGSAGSNTLVGGGGNDTLVGYGGNDFYRADDAGDIILESAGNGYDQVFAATSYTLTAGQAIEALWTIDPGATTAINLTGNALANEIYGNAGANTIDGKAGTDLLFGGGGADIFAFTTSYDGGDIDRILDFVSGTDKIGLANELFPFLGAEGALSANAFVVGTAAGDADDRVIYNAATGQLFYDYDGNGAQVAVLFATLSGNPTLTASDFVVI